MTAQQFPITSIRKLSQVARGLTDQKTAHALRSLDPITEAAFLPNATALANAIAEFAPELAARSPLRIAVTSFEAADGVDSGRWFQIAASLLARSELFEIDYITFGPYIAGDETPSRIGYLLGHLPAATSYRCTMSEYVAKRGAPDIVFACHLNPLLSDEDIYDLSWVPSLLSEGTCILGWAFTALERDLLCSTMKANGWGELRYSTARVYGTSPLPNTHSIDNGRFLWQIYQAEAPSLEVNKQAVTDLLMLSRRHGAALDTRTAHPWCGQAIVVPGYPGGVAFSVDSHAASLSDGKRLRATARVGASAPTVTVIGEAERWTPVSLSEAQACSPVEISRLADSAFAQYLFPKDTSIDSLFGDDAMESMTDGWDAETAAGLKRMAAMINAKTGAELGHPLFIAAENDDAEAIRQLARDGMDLELRDNSGRTALITAASNNATHAVEALLESGVDVDAVLGFNHMTPAQVAVTHGAMASLLILLKHGANIDHVTPFGQNLVRSFLESGQGGAAVQAWYRDGLISGRIPPTPSEPQEATPEEQEAADVLSRLSNKIAEMHEAMPGLLEEEEDIETDELPIEQVTFDHPIIFDGMSALPTGPAAGAHPRVVVSRPPVEGEEGEEEEDRVWQIEVELNRDGERLARLRVLLIECADAPFGYYSMEDSEEWSSTLFHGPEELAPQVADAWETDDLYMDWIARIVDMDLLDKHLPLHEKMLLVMPCILLASGIAEEFLNGKPYFAMDDCPTPNLATTPNALERLDRRRLIEFLGGVRANPVDHAMFDIDGERNICHGHPWVYVLPYEWPEGMFPGAM